MAPNFPSFSRADLMRMARSAQTRRRAAAVMLLVVLACAVWVSGRRFVADVLRADARQVIEGRYAGKAAPPRERVDEIQAQLIRAAELDPGNPWVRHDLAHLQTVRLARLNRFDPAARDALSVARESYRQTALLRPTWERAWLGVAISRQVPGEVDGEYLRALELASRYGPWNQAVQMGAIHSGLTAWMLLPPQVQADLRAAIHRQAHWRLSPQGGALRTMIAGQRRIELLCLLDPGPSGCRP